MARIRTVKPEFWQHPKVTSVGRDARLLFLGLLNEADDEGKLRYLPKTLAGVLFTNDEDVDAAWVRTRTDELERAGLVHTYMVDDAPLLLVCGFTEHQKVSHPSPSRLPSPPEPDDNAPETLPRDSGRSPESLRPDMDLGNGTGSKDLGSELALVVAEPSKPTVKDVFEFWRSECNHPGAKLDDKRRARIAWALNEYPADDVADAIRGAAASPYHQGQNSNGTIYDDPTLIFRDATHLERFRDQYRSGPVRQVPKAWGALDAMVRDGAL